MKRNNKSNVYHFTHTKITYDTEQIRNYYSFIFYVLLFFEFTLYPLAVKLLVGQLVDAKYQDAVNAFLYLFLYVIICITAFVIKKFARNENGGQNPFAEKELGKIALKALVLTGVFYFAFSVEEPSMSSAPFVGVLAGLLAGFVFSLDEGLDRDDIEGLTEYLKQAAINLLKRCMDWISLICFVSIPVTVGAEVLMAKRPILFWIIWCSIFVGSMILWLLYHIPYFKITKRIKDKATDHEVLILEYTPNRVLIQKITKSLRKSGAKYKVIESESDVFKKQYDVVIIVDALSQSKQLLQAARVYLNDGGIVIAPAYTSHKNKSKLISEYAYIEKLSERGWNVLETFSCKMVGITYVELERMSKDRRKTEG